jgi:hypothetical protein
MSEVGLRNARDAASHHEVNRIFSAKSDPVVGKDIECGRPIPAF